MLQWLGGSYTCKGNSFVGWQKVSGKIYTKIFQPPLDLFFGRRFIVLSISTEVLRVGKAVTNFTPLTQSTTSKELWFLAKDKRNVLVCAFCPSWMLARNHSPLTFSMILKQQKLQYKNNVKFMEVLKRCWLIPPGYHVSIRPLKKSRILGHLYTIIMGATTKPQEMPNNWSKLRAPWWSRRQCGLSKWRGR